MMGTAYSKKLKDKNHMASVGYWGESGCQVVRGYSPLNAGKVIVIYT